MPAVTVYPENLVYIDQTNPDTNFYGNDLIIGGIQRVMEDTYRPHFTFDIPNNTTISLAIFFLHVYHPNGYHNYVYDRVELYNPFTITWNNSPSVISNIANLPVGYVDRDNVEIYHDITSGISNIRGGTIAIRMQALSSDWYSTILNAHLDIVYSTGYSKKIIGISSYSKVNGIDKSNIKKIVGI